MTNRLLWNSDGKTLDEIVYHGYVHVEQMDDDHYWMGVGDSHFDFRVGAPKRLHLTGYDISAKDFPLEQRHPTQAEFDTFPAFWYEEDDASAYITIRDDRSDKEKIDAKAQWLASKDGKGWKQLTAAEKDDYRALVPRDQ
jgi:hypothetical protein